MIKSSTIAALAETLRDHVARLQPGDQLPSTRDIVKRHRVSPVSVARALAILVADGLVTTRPGAGTFVAERRPLTAPDAVDSSWQTVALGDRAIDASALQVYLEAIPAGTIAMAGGYLHHSMRPNRALSSALMRAARLPDAWDRPPLQGVSSLRAWFAESIGGGVTAEDVVITSGGQAAMSVALRAIVPAGAPLLVEAPTYPGALAVARAAGIRPVPVPIDSNGIRPDLLAEAFRVTDARAVYLQPTYQNPTGAVLSPERREQVLSVAHDAGAFIIEDDYARALSHDGPPPPPLIADDVDGRVVHIASLTKPAAPSLRVGALSARGPVAERIRALRIVDDLFVARFLQDAALELVTAPGWPRYLSGLSAELRRRRQRLLAALTEHAPGFQVALIPRGGMHIWVRLPDGTDENAVFAACRQAGVLGSMGRAYFAAESPGPYMRLSFVGAPHLDDLDEGVRRLASAVR
jgi:DNA-binding transcriptional MocR family regulator